MSGCCVPTGEVYLSDISLMISGQHNDISYSAKKNSWRDVWDVSTVQVLLRN